MRVSCYFINNSSVLWPTCLTYFRIVVASMLRWADEAFSCSRTHTGNYCVGNVVCASPLLHLISFVSNKPWIIFYYTIMSTV